MQPTITVLITQAPYGTVHAAEAVRHLNGALNEGFLPTAILTDDGVWLARSGQNATIAGYVSRSDTLVASMQREGARPRVLVHRPSLEVRGLQPGDLIPGAELVDDSALAQAVSAAQYLLRF